MVGLQLADILWPLRLDLKNMRSRQARLMAEATSGKESEAWYAAALYLAQLELDARTAEQLALEAVTLTEHGQWSSALERAESAVQLEAKYRPSETWRLMRDEIAAELQQH